MFTQRVGLVVLDVASINNLINFDIAILGSPSPLHMDFISVDAFVFKAFSERSTRGLKLYLPFVSVMLVAHTQFLRSALDAQKLFC